MTGTRIGQLIMTGMVLMLTINSGYASSANAMEKSMSAASGYVDMTKLEKLSDQYMAERIGNEEGAPGAAIVVVQNGRTILKKGYGFADIKRKAAVDPDHTLFRIGSVTKTFTASAIMQLAEQGKIDLSADVQKYMGGIRLDNPFSTPVTVHDLLTHTSGFKVTVETQADMSEDLGSYVPLEDFILKKKPPVVREPGTSYMYDNFAYNLLGYIIEKVSGMPYQQYMEEHILKPLEMSNTEMIISDQLRSRLATGYDENNNPIAPYTLQPSVAPDGGMLTTADDAAHFMIAQLNGGMYRNNRLWNDTTAAQMQHYQSGIHPESPDTTYGYENLLEPGKNNGRIIIGKGGDVPGYSSFMLLLPEENIGVFMAFNKLVSSAYAAREWNQMFMDEFFPAVSQEQAAYMDTPQHQLKRFAGLYSDLRVPIMLTKVSASGNGELTVEDDFTGVHQLRQREPLLFKDENGGLLAFKEDKNGGISYLKYGDPVSYAGKSPALFADVRLGSEYATCIEQLQAIGIVQGNNGRYSPGKAVTRAEMAAMIVRMLGSDLSTAPSRFNDVSGTWAEREIETAAAAGFMQGTKDGSFDPNRKMTREEAAAILTPVFKSVASAALSQFRPDAIKLADKTDFAAPATADSAKLLVAAGITGPDVTVAADGTVNFRASEPMTREDAAVWFIHFIRKVVLGIDQ
ncbi:serine hydrolase [Paenibacillus sp. HN-1]|uniref:serine hydrolase n=1 Tax=Paenibacillus TaxID=44249 RepID=UPI001CA8F391|nr:MULTISPECIES: serine hydrolase [Paenibacillus]MBY9077941.1 serine hydrolase [Paenibacillus sp. CGMCC 1.18879]MBY9084643.1 serine hydrolase [Paenibacillus sinensis]